MGKARHNRTPRCYFAMKHMSHNSSCGTPLEEWVRVEGENGKMSEKHCPNCIKLKVRDCLICSKKFQPGCRIRFTCMECNANTRNKFDENTLVPKRY